MNAKHLVFWSGCCLLALALTGASPPQAFADDREHSNDHRHGNKHGHSKGELVRIVRESTERFRDVRIAEAEGYQLHFGCVSGPDEGAMGLHYVNMSLVDGTLDPARPEIIIYEPLRNGRVRLIGADFLAPVEAWHAENGAAPPQLVGQLLQLFRSPNRFGLPDFYTLHVWAWKKNPHGMFVNWHPRVSCHEFDGQAF